MGQAIPNPVIQRLTKYLVHVQGLREEGVEWVLSQEIAEALTLTSSTVRQDLSHLDFSGVSKRGYETEKLEAALRAALGADEKANVVLVGVGNLGRALALHGELERRGFMMCGVFDADPRVVGKKIGSLQVQGMDELASVVKKRNVDIGMIAVPAASAQEVGERLVAAGVKGLLNLTPAHVRAPQHVSVVDARIVASLQELLYFVRNHESLPPADDESPED